MAVAVHSAAVGFGDLGDLVAIDIGKANHGALVQQGLSDGAANALCSARHDAHAVRNASHWRLS